MNQNQEISLKVSIDDLIHQTPQVSIQTDIEKAIQTGLATFLVCAQPGGNGVGNIFIFHNEKPLDELSRALKVLPRDNCRSFTLTLFTGVNEFTGAAYDKDNGVYGKSSPLYIIYEPPKIEKPDMHILAIGISKYQDRNIRLNSPAADALSIERAMSTVGKNLYGVIKSVTLVNEKGSKDKIMAALEEVQNKAKNIDTVILFFAGHGDTENGIYYFMPYNANIADIQGSGISVNEISQFVRKLRAQKVAIFFDTCKSGSATRALSVIALARGLEERKIIARLSRERGIAVFSAANASQEAFEIKSLGHGIFTYALLEVLKNRREEISNGKLISLGKLLNTVNRMTRDLALKYLKVEQSPILYFFGEDFSLGLK